MKLAPWCSATTPRWQRRAIRTIGYTASGSGFPPSLQGQTGLELPFYKVKHLAQSDERGALTSADDSIDRETAAKLGANVFPAGTLVYAKVGAALMLSRVRTLPVAACIDNNMAGLTPDDGVDPRFLFWAMSQVRFDYLVNPGAVPSLSDRNLLDYPLLVPPLDEQRAIADFLDRETARIDTLIEGQQRLIDLLRERRTSVVRNSVPDTRRTGPNVDKLGRRSRIGNGSTPRREVTAFWDGGHIPWLNSSVVNQKRVTVATQFVTQAAVAQCHLPSVQAGSVLVALTGEGKTRGTAALLAIDATINQHMAYITPDRDAWNSEYLFWSLSAEYERLRAISSENGSTKGALTCESLKRFRIARPSLEEQRRIATYLDDQTSKIDVLIEETEKFIELSRERRAAIITAAVTGQIDVRDEVAG